MFIFPLLISSIDVQGRILDIDISCTKKELEAYEMQLYCKDFNGTSHHAGSSQKQGEVATIKARKLEYLGHEKRPEI